MKQRIFTGAATALVTPMFEDGSVNFKRLNSLIKEQITAGIDALIICGTTGEKSTLRYDEHAKVIEESVKAADGKVPIIAGTGSNDTVYSVELCNDAEKAGADAFLMVAPYYNKTSQRGLIAHYTAVAASADLPMILYNVPSRTGLNIQPETVVTLAKVDNIVGLKQANGDLSSVAKIAALCDLPIYSGNDDQIVPILSLGGLGVISVLSNVIPRETHDICQTWFDGNVEESKRLQLHYLDLANGLFTDVNPIPVKEALNLMGWNVGDCRLPLYPMEDAARDKLAAILRAHGLIG